MTVGEKIRAERKKAKLTQKALGELCGINEVQLRQYEIGKANPKFDTLQKIATALNLPITELLDISIKNLPQSKAIPDYYIDLRNELVSLFDRLDNDDYKDKAYGLMSMYERLNNLGKDKAVEQVELLTKIPEYKKEN